MAGERHQLMAVCWDCGQVFGTQITLGPGESFSGQGHRTACPRCRHIVDIPDGEYGVIDGAVQWLRQFRTAEQREQLAGVLQQATEHLRAGATAEAVADEITRATGLQVWDFLISEKGAALAAWIGLVLTLITMFTQNGAAPPPATPPQTHVTLVINNVAPPVAPQSPAEGPDADR